MTETVWLAIIGVIVMILKEYFDRTRAKHAAKEVAIVKANLEKVDSRDKVILEKSDAIIMNKLEEGNAVQSLVNSKLLSQMKFSMLAMQRIAELTGKEEDKKAAKDAEKIYYEHEGVNDRVILLPSK